MVSKIYYWILLLLCSSALHAQEIDAAAFFSRPYTADTNAGGALPPPPRFSYLSNVELRTETDEFDVDRQQYNLRLKPTGRGRLRAQRALADHLETRPDFTSEEKRCITIEQRYEDWLELYHLETELRIIDTLALVLKDKKTILDRQSARLDFSWSDLIDLRQRQTDLALRRLKLLERRDGLLTANGYESVRLDFTGLLRPEDVFRSSTIPPNLTPDPELTYELETVNRELDLERTESKQYLDFVEATYQGPHDDLFRERLSVGLALQFPNSGNQKIKIRELELERRDILREQIQEKQKSVGEITALRQEIDRGQELYRQTEFLLRGEQKDLALMARNISRKAGVNPLSLLRIQERRLRNEIRLKDQYVDLLEVYLSWQVEGGHLCDRPDGNLLLR